MTTLGLRRGFWTQSRIKRIDREPKLNDSNPQTTRRQVICFTRYDYRFYEY
jgi:hypothetical protein